jgi:hypothetical protein
MVTLRACLGPLLRVDQVAAGGLGLAVKPRLARGVDKPTLPTRVGHQLAIALALDGHESNTSEPNQQAILFRNAVFENS